MKDKTIRPRFLNEKSSSFGEASTCPMRACSCPRVINVTAAQPRKSNVHARRTRSGVIKASPRLHEEQCDSTRVHHASMTATCLITDNRPRPSRSNCSFTRDDRPLPLCCYNLRGFFLLSWCSVILCSSFDLPRSLSSKRWIITYNILFILSFAFFDSNGGFSSS